MRWRPSLSSIRKIGTSLALGACCFAASCARPSASPKGEILVWHWMTDREDALQNLTDQYSKNTGIKVRLELYAPSDAYAAKVRAAAQTNTLPDIFSVLGEVHDLARFVNAGHVADLAPAMNADHGSWFNQFYAKALSTNTFKSGNAYQVPPGIYGVPIDFTNIQFLYNKDLFKQAGLNPDRPPQTWPEFIEAWHKLKAAGLPGLVSGWGETWMIDCFASNYAFNVMGENKVLDTFRGTVPYTDPDWIRVLRLFDDLRKEDLLVPGVVTMVNKTAEQTFANGKAAFTFNGSWSVNVYKGMNPDLVFGAMLPPRLTDAYPMRIWGGAGSSFMVNAQSPNNEQATQFLKWLTGPVQEAYLAKETANIPANRQSSASLSPTLAAFANQMDATTHPSQWPLTESPIVTEALDKGIQSILIGEKTPEQVGAEVEVLKKQQLQTP